MADSNAEWGVLQENDSEIAAAWDTFEPLPDEGENVILDGFCQRKHITIPSLLRLGARLSDGDTLAFAYDEGLKFRNMIDGRMWSYAGSTWPYMKIVRAGAQPTRQLLVCEGESDGARLTTLYQVDVGVMPAGARYFPESMVRQISDYDQVIIALDPDTAGEAGAVKIRESHNNTVRFYAPDDGDWCDFAGHTGPPLPAIEDGEDLSSETFVPAGVMLHMEVPDVASWYDSAVLPIGGQMILHGWAKSFKTWLALDLLAQLAQGQDWCGFEPLEEPVKVGVIQFEITWPYYHQRIEYLRQHAREPQLFEENLYTYTPMQRPQLIAGNTQQEDVILNALTSNDIQIVLLDPIRRAVGNADLNAENEVRKMLHFFERLQDAGVTVIATHHDNKEGARAGGGTAVSMTGSGAFAGDADTVVSVELPRGSDPNTSDVRNLNFLLRNAPAIQPRSMKITDDGGLIYSNEPVYRAGEDELDVQTDAPEI